MFAALKKALLAFGESAGDAASHLGHVLKEDWDALVAAVEGEADSARKDLVKGVTEAAAVVKSIVSDAHVAVQLPAGGLHQLSALVAEVEQPIEPPAPPVEPPAPPVEPPAPPVEHQLV